MSLFARGSSEYERDRKLRRRYGLGLRDRDALLAGQGGGCAICGKQDGEGRRHRLHVDHDHATGRVRGLLCYHCNAGLGFWESLGGRVLKYLAGALAPMEWSAA